MLLGTTIVAGSMALWLMPSRAADDGAALYKSKCVACHGTKGEGKPAIKAPALKGTSLTTDQLVERVTKGEPSSKPPQTKGCPA